MPVGLPKLRTKLLLKDQTSNTAVHTASRRVSGWLYRIYTCMLHDGVSDTLANTLQIHCGCLNRHLYTLMRPAASNVTGRGAEEARFSEKNEKLKGKPDWEGNTDQTTKMRGFCETRVMPNGAKLTGITQTHTTGLLSLSHTCTHTHARTNTYTP